MLNYHNATFLKSVANISELPKDTSKEVAFIGRSNAGKSSALNALTQQKNLAKISKTPGRTQCINFFSLSNNCYLVDLPGYGYAKVPKELKDKWHKLIDQYLTTRNSLCGLILLMDIRHPFKDFEKEVLSWASKTQIPIHILLTKADKLSRGAQLSTLKQTQNFLEKNKLNATVFLFSAKTNIGIELLRSKLDEWFGE